MPTLNWMGKDKVVNHHNDVPYKVLEQKYSFDNKGKHEDSNGSENMIIHGDNLEALKSLLPKYEGRIKCIYIDPPYNTGNEKWVYNDNVNDPRIKKWLGEVVGKEGEDFSRHDKWLCMMYPRLKLLQKLLSDDGAIFISIDDNEQANLKLICDEIFGSNNFITTIMWKSRAKPSNTGEAKYRPQKDGEYILIYKKQEIPNFLEVKSEKQRSYPHTDEDGNYRLQTILKSNRGENRRDTMCFSINGYTPPATKRWQAGKERIQELFDNNRITFQTGEPMLKYYEHEENVQSMPFWCHIPSEITGTAEKGKNILNDILGNLHGFDTVKPVDVVIYVLSRILNKNDIILDSFAGSGTTAHAVLNMNKADGGNRKFILIEMEDYADTITAERVKRVIKGYGEDKKKVEGVGGDFSYYELGEPIFKDNLLNPAVSADKIREYVYYMETKKPLENPIDMDEPYFMAIHDNTAYYFFYEKDEETVLDLESLNMNVKQKAESYVIYADSLLLDEAFLAKHNITFKKIPRDIARL